MKKNKTLKSLKNIISLAKKKGKKIVFTNGCFDLIHPGHIKILKEAKKHGSILIVGLNSDKSIRAIKSKKRPILKQSARIKVLSSIKYVDYIALFQQKTPYGLIKKLKPNVLVKGGDWPKEKIVGKNLVEKIVRVKLKPGYSTTKIIEKIKRNG